MTRHADAQVKVAGRTAAVAFNPSDTSRLSGKGFRRPFSALNRALVAGITCPLASTGASVRLPHTRRPARRLAGFAGFVLPFR